MVQILTNDEHKVDLIYIGVDSIIQSGLENRTCSEFGWLMAFGLSSGLFEIGTFVSLGRFIYSRGSNLEAIQNRNV